jgi:hypothetical protein
MRAAGEPIPSICRALGVKRATLYNTLSEIKDSARLTRGAERIGSGPGGSVRLRIRDVAVRPCGHRGSWRRFEWAERIPSASNDQKVITRR